MKLVLFFILSLTLTPTLQVAEASEIKQFRAEWCAPNQLIAQDIKFICVGSAQFEGIGSTRAFVIQRADQTRELFVEKDFSSIDMLNLQFEIFGPVATNKPRERFEAKYNGTVRLQLDADGEVEAVSGSIRFLEQFFATRP